MAASLVLSPLCAIQRPGSVGAVVSGAREQELLIQAMASGMALSDRQQLFQWARGPLQALLPHEALLCMQVDESGRTVRTLCLHQSLLDSVALGEMTNVLGPALATAWRAGPGIPVVIGAGALSTEVGVMLRASGGDDALVHGTAPAAGASTVFALLGMPGGPDARHAWRLQLLLPYLHLGLLRMPSRGMRRQGREALSRPLSTRELTILEAVRIGLNNEDIALQLGLSALTVKNHLQRAYRVLGVANRAHAVARCLALKLI